MSNYYRLDFQDLEFWKLKEDPNTNEKYYERVKESGSFYLKETAPLMFDGRLCNYEGITTHQYIRMRTLGSLYVIEPSNLIIPIKNMKKISGTEEIVNTDPILFRNISIDTFICNFISDFTRGGKNRISEEEVRRKSKKTQLTSEQEKEEELFKTYGLLNNTLWMLVMGNTRFEERTPLLNKFDAYRSKISVLEHTLYFNGRIDSEVEALDRARMDSVSEAIPGFDYIKII